MRTIDRTAIEKLGIPGIVLMENAALCVTSKAVSMLENKEKELKAAVKEIDLSKKKLQSMFEAKSSEGTEHNQPDAGQNMEKTLPSAPAESKPVHNNAVALGSSDSDSTADRISNQQILDLYSQGKSVLEISRMLDLGQGEVKLVIDLFKGKK